MLSANIGAAAGNISGNFTAGTLQTTGNVNAGNLRVVTNSSVGTVVSGTWNGSSISTTYTDAKVVSVNGQTGAATGFATTANSLAQFASTTSTQLAGIISGQTGNGALVFGTSPTLVNPILGTPTSANLINATSLPISTGVSGLGAGVATFLATPSAANLANVITNETGTGNLVFSNSPTLVTPNIGVATGTSFTGAILSRVVTIADANSITINADTTDVATQINTQTAGTLTINAPTGTAVNGQKFILRLTSSNVQTFSSNTIFTGSTDIALPTVSSGGGLTDYLGFIYNSTAAKWQMIAKVFGF